MNSRIFVDFYLPPEAAELLREGTAGHELIGPARPAASVLNQAEPDLSFASADIAFGQPDPVAVAGSERLRWMHVSSSGITRYDTPEFRRLIRERGTLFSNSAGVYHDACAVHALSFLLAEARQLPRSLATRTPGGSPIWHALRESSVPLVGQTAVILGFGAIGARLAEYLRPLGMEVVAHRRCPRGNEGLRVVTDQDLPAILAAADHVFNILPDSAETRRFFDRGRFAQIKPGAVFYNIGRGGTVDQEALLEVLRAGLLKAAWLDVTDPEPLPDDHGLWREPNCHVTPHVAGGHVREAVSLVRHFLANFGRFQEGLPLLDRVE